MKLILASIIFSICAFFVIVAPAHSKDPHHTPPESVQGPMGETGARGKAGRSDASSAALGIATGQHQFDWDTYKWQGSVGVGVFEDDSAASIGFAKRLCPSCGSALINGSFGVTEDGDHGGGAGIGWQW